MTPRAVLACLTCGLWSIACGASQPAPVPPPRAAPPAAAPLPPEPPAPPAPPSPRSSEPLLLKEVAQVALQPSRARTSAQETEGSVADVAFLPPDGRYVVGGGNDDRIWIVDLQTGAAHWKSPQLGKDVERIDVCAPRIVAQTYEGRVAVYEWVSEGRPRVIDRGRFELGMGALRGAFGGCAQIAYAAQWDKLLVFDVLLGRTAKVLRDVSYAVFESRANEHGWIFVYGADGVRLYNLSDDQVLPSALAVEGPDGRLTQAHVVSSNRILTEHCATAKSCVVRLVESNGTPRVEHRFEISGSVWGVDVPSRIAFSTDARYFFWYRDGLPLQVVETETGRRAQLPPIARTMATVVNAAFSPYAPGTLAVTLSPAPSRVTVYEIR